MNLELTKYSVSGKVVDVGGGENPSYLGFLEAKDAEVTSIDLRRDEQSGARIDLETSCLPYDDDSVDDVLMFNILEHIYNHRHLIGESYRILKPGGRVLGFVPFLINYHPDPSDFFRYTKEALARIFAMGGFKIEIIKEIGRGPFAVNFNNLAPALPKVMGVIIFPVYYFMDWLFLKMRPKARERFPLGYFFELVKSHE